MTNKAKFLALVTENDYSTLEQVKWRIQNRNHLRASQQIALQVLMRLDELNWEQRDLAREMGVSSLQVNKIVRGKESLEFEIQVKLQALLGISIIAS